jgi:type IV pilus biogenesis protein PilP
MKNPMKLKLLALSLIAVLGAGIIHAQALPTPQVDKVIQDSKTQPTDMAGVTKAAEANPASTSTVATPVTAKSAVAPASASTSSTPASASSVATVPNPTPVDSSKAEPDAQRFALSSSNSDDSVEDLKGFVNSSENSVYETSAIQSEIDLINKRIEKINSLINLKKAQDKLLAVKSGKPLDKDGNPIPEKTEEDKKADLATNLLKQAVVEAKPKSQVVAVYGFNGRNLADVMSGGDRETKKVGDTIDGRTVLNISDKGVLVSNGKGSKPELLPIDTNYGPSLTNNAIKNAIPGMSNTNSNFGTFGGNNVNQPNATPTSFDPNANNNNSNSSSNGNSGVPTPLNFNQVPSPPQLMPPSPSVTH